MCSCSHLKSEDPLSRRRYNALSAEPGRYPNAHHTWDPLNVSLTWMTIHTMTACLPLYKAYLTYSLPQAYYIGH